jgi:hypothetical protein
MLIRSPPGPRRSRRKRRRHQGCPGVDAAGSGPAATARGGDPRGSRAASNDCISLCSIGISRSDDSPGHKFFSPASPGCATRAPPGVRGVHEGGAHGAALCLGGEATRGRTDQLDHSALAAPHPSISFRVRRRFSIRSARSMTAMPKAGSALDGPLSSERVDIGDAGPSDMTDIAGRQRLVVPQCLGGELPVLDRHRRVGRMIRPQRSAASASKTRIREPYCSTRDRSQASSRPASDGCVARLSSMPFLMSPRVMTLKNRSVDGTDCSQPMTFGLGRFRVSSETTLVSSRKLPA